MLGVALSLAAVVASVWAPTASAGTASLTGAKTQRLVYRASGGERNRVTVKFARGVFAVHDGAGVKAGPGCSRVDTRDAACTVTASGGQGGASVSLGNGNDSATVSGVGTRLDGGPCNDRLKGSGHADTLLGGTGNDVLDGGVEQDRLVGGSGNDRIIGRDAFTDRVSCGPGLDQAKLDGLDYFADRCELVKRSDRPGATVIDLTTSSRGGGTATVLLACPRDAVLGCQGRASIRTRGHPTFGNAPFRLRRPGLGSERIHLPADVTARLRSGGFNVTVVLRTHQGRLRRTVTVPQLLPGL
jgi:Ca2+-binding RTX toxin-like protein